MEAREKFVTHELATTENVICIECITIVLITQCTEHLTAWHLFSPRKRMVGLLTHVRV